MSDSLREKINQLVWRLEHAAVAGDRSPSIVEMYPLLRRMVNELRVEPLDQPPAAPLDQPFIDSEQRMRAGTSPIEQIIDDASFLVPTGYVLTVDIAIGGATPFIPRTADIVVPNPSIVRIEGARLKVYERKAGH